MDAEKAKALFIWASGKYHEAFDSFSSASGRRLEPSQWRLRGRLRESSDASIRVMARFTELKNRYYADYARHGGTLSRDALDQAALLAHRTRRERLKTEIHQTPCSPPPT